MKFDKQTIAVLSMDIRDIGLSTRALNAFCRHYWYVCPCSAGDLITANDLYRTFKFYPREEFLKWRSVGPKVYQEYEMVLTRLGLIKK